MCWSKLWIAGRICRKRFCLAIAPPLCSSLDYFPLFVWASSLPAFLPNTLFYKNIEPCTSFQCILGVLPHAKPKWVFNALLHGACETNLVFIPWLEHAVCLQHPSLLPLLPHASSLPPPTTDSLVQSAAIARQGLKNLLEKSTPLANFPLSSIRQSTAEWNPVQTCQNEANQASRKQLKHAVLESTASLPRTAINNSGRACITWPVPFTASLWCVAVEGSPREPQTGSSGWASPRAQPNPASYTTSPVHPTEFFHG